MNAPQETLDRVDQLLAAGAEFANIARSQWEESTEVAGRAAQLSQAFTELAQAHIQRHYAGEDY